jgi:hypothetical protein
MRNRGPTTPRSTPVPRTMYPSELGHPMPLYIAQHEHPADRCPAGNPQMAPALLQLVSNSNAEKHGIKIHADGVLKGKHHLYVIVDGPSEESVRKYFAPFGMAGTLEVAPASHCEEVVAQGHC